MSNPDVAAVFPITPQTELMHKFSSYVHDGVVDTELILVESEHSAQSACFGAASAGARTVTATSSQGLLLMAEICAITAATRLPVVMPVVNRAISAPVNIGCDHSDSMFLRDAGWIQLYCENGQEVYDTVVQAFRIGEHKDVLLPVMVCLDGFIISHTMEGVELIGPEAARQFVGEYDPAFRLLDTAKPITVGPLHLTDYYFECKRQVVEAMRTAQRVIVEVGREYGRLTGREYGLFEPYRLDDAEVAIVALGSTCGTAKVAADRAREQGHPGRRAEAPLVPALPGRGNRRGPAARRRGGRAGPFDLLRAAGRAAVPRGPLVRRRRAAAAGQLRLRPWRPRHHAQRPGRRVCRAGRKRPSAGGGRHVSVHRFAGVAA